MILVIVRQHNHGTNQVCQVGPKDEVQRPIKERNEERTQRSAELDEFSKKNRQLV